MTMPPDKLAEAIQNFVAQANAAAPVFNRLMLACIEQQIAILVAADPRNIAQDGRNGLSGYAGLSSTETEPHGANTRGSE